MAAAIRCQESHPELRRFMQELTRSSAQATVESLKHAVECKDPACACTATKRLMQHAGTCKDRACTVAYCRSTRQFMRSVVLDKMKHVADAAADADRESAAATALMALGAGATLADRVGAHRTCATRRGGAPIRAAVVLR